MIDGIVTNCWQSQLSAGETLDELIGEAARRGYRAIELRQGALGEFETNDREPIAEALSVLPSNHPGIRFNVAVEQAYLSPQAQIDRELFSAGKWAADAVAGETPPHLRLVDLATTNADWESIEKPAGIEEAAARVVELTRSMIEIDGVLSLEHALQRWEWFRSIFDAARRQLGRDAKRLKICFDPCNLLAAGETVAPRGVAETLSADAISLVHFKQRRAGETTSVLEDGDVDWKSVSGTLKQIGYIGPGLLEIPPSADIWEHLESSREYLHQLAP